MCEIKALADILKIKSANYVVVGGFEEGDDEAHETLVNAVRNLEDVTCARIHDASDAGLPFPFAIFLDIDEVGKTEDDVPQLSGEWTEENIEHFARTYKLPLVVPFSDKTARAILVATSIRI